MAPRMVADHMSPSPELSKEWQLLGSHFADHEESGLNSFAKKEIAQFSRVRPWAVVESQAQRFLRKKTAIEVMIEQHRKSPLQPGLVASSLANIPIGDNFVLFDPARHAV